MHEIMQKVFRRESVVHVKKYRNLFRCDLLIVFYVPLIHHRKLQCVMQVVDDLCLRGTEKPSVVQITVT